MSNNPEQYKTAAVINDQIVHIRPVTDSDSFAQELISGHNPGELYALDYDKKMAFVAVVKDSDGEERHVGVARYECDQYEHCKATLSVADGWHEHGLGQVLMKQLVEFARGTNKELLYLVELTENTSMRLVARDLGMDSQRDSYDPKIMRHELLL